MMQIEIKIKENCNEILYKEKFLMYFGNMIENQIIIIGAEFFEETLVFEISTDELGKSEYGNIVPLKINLPNMIKIREFPNEKIREEESNIYFFESYYKSKIFHELCHFKFYKILELNNIIDDNENIFEYSKGKTFINEYFATRMQYNFYLEKDTFLYNDILSKLYEFCEKNNRLEISNCLDSFIRFLPYTLGYSEIDNVINEIKRIFINKFGEKLVEKLNEINELSNDIFEKIEKLTIEDINKLGKKIQELRILFLEYNNN